MLTNIRRVYAHMETYILGFAGHGAGMNVSNKDVYHDQFNNSNIHSICKGTTSVSYSFVKTLLILNSLL